MDDILQMLIYLLSGIEKTVQYYCTLTGKSERTVKRNIKTLKDLGFDIRTKGGFVFLANKSDESKLLYEYLGFSIKEAQVLNKSLENLDAPKSIVQSLQKKLGLFDHDELIHMQVRKEDSEFLNTVYQAITKKKQVFLKNYSSGGTTGISDKLVEPFEFTNNPQYVMCYEPSSQNNKLFRIDRAEDCIMTTLNWEHEDLHKSLPYDAFRICGTLNKRVVLYLTPLARNLLIEEYPKTVNDITDNGDGTFTYSGTVAGYLGVSRFCMSLPDNVKIIESDDLKKYIIERQKNSL